MEGVVPAIVTPFKENEDIDFESLNLFLNFLGRNGVKWIFALGSTGEFNMLSLSEKQEFIRKLREITKLKIIVNVSENSLKNTLSLGKLAFDVGMEGIALIPPIYHKPSESGLISYFEEMSKLGLPLYVYAYPDKVPITYETISKLVKQDIIDGIKLTTDNLPLFKKYLGLKEIKNDLKILIGSDTLFIYSLIEGGNGCISAVANVAPELMMRAYQGVREGKLNESLEIQEMISKISDAIMSGDFPSGVKVALRYRGVSVGSVRRPLKESIEVNARIYSVLKELGM
ncbi:dihydrodipicolinate synthase [Sulfolobus acidocaldarius SUSAZ]|nr:dihydrodipicolinate synthase [Sulfolobus acidocaldarius SUSAZ]